MRTGLLAAACAASLVLGGGAAQALTVIDFEADAAGAKADGFTSTGFDELVFSTDLGAGLEVGNYGPQSDGQALLSRDDTNGNFIVGRFLDGLHSFISLDFGNDDPAFTNPGDRAVLTVFNGATMVGQTVLMLSPNDIMDQTIGFMFGQFDNFTFAYTDANGSPFTGGGGVNVGLIEVIDNITYDTLATAVPEPAAWAMMILGFGGVGAMLRQRRRLAAA